MMKKLMVVAMLLTLVLSVAPAMANDKTPASFGALSKLSTLDVTSITQMTDAQLAEIIGGEEVNVTIGNITQTNTSTISAANTCSGEAECKIKQSRNRVKQKNVVKIKIKVKVK